MATTWFEHPTARHPAVLVAFSGWGDAAQAATGAAEYVLRSHGGGRKVAEIGSDGFFNFQLRRPIVSLLEGGTREVLWPEIEVFLVDLEEEARDLVVVLGEEPHLRWREFAATLIELLGTIGAGQVVTLGAFIAQVAHTQPVPVVGVVSDPELLERYRLLPSNYEGPTGIVGVLNDAFEHAGLSSASLWAAVPHYLAGSSNPRAMLALVERAVALTGLAVDTTQLVDEATEFQGKVDAAVAESAELRGYVKRLERAGQVPQMQADAGHKLVEEIEQFLRSEGR